MGPRPEKGDSKEKPIVPTTAVFLSGPSPRDLLVIRAASCTLRVGQEIEGGVVVLVQGQVGLPTADVGSVLLHCRGCGLRCRSEAALTFVNSIAMRPAAAAG